MTVILKTANLLMHNQVGWELIMTAKKIEVSNPLVVLHGDEMAQVYRQHHGHKNHLFS